jgi:serine/threonine protein kinase
MTASPLPVGAVLAERFELLEVLSQSVFTTTYKAKDGLRGDLCVVKELSPEGATRDDNDVLDLSPLGVGAQHLRQRFLDEVRRVGRLNLPSILPVRSTFSERGTAFYVIDYIPGATTVTRHVLEFGRMPYNELVEMLSPLMDTLEGMHDRRVVHKDIRPENLLLTPSKKLILVGPGGAREWLADAREAQDVFFNSPYAPPEETTDRLDRGLATDVYGLCATLHFMLTGTPPPSAIERADGVAVPPIPLIRRDVDAKFVAAIETGMSLQYLERPQSIGELRRMIEPDDGFEDAEERLERLDQLIYKMRNFSFEKRQCPSCRGVLETLRPLPKGHCPVCHDGLIKKRELHERFCPACSGGVLKTLDNSSPLEICPVCHTGRLETKRKSFLSKEIVSRCAKCDAHFEVEGEKAKLIEPEQQEGKGFQVGDTQTWDEWRQVSGRPAELLACDTCDAQYDPVGDGRWQQIVPVPTKWRSLYPDEWAKVAAGLDPIAGNAECTSCKADYHVEGDKVTLLAAHRDPFGFAERHRGRLLKGEDLAWKGAGKESPNPGLVCSECQAEMDFDGEDLRLIRSTHPVLRRAIGHTKTLEDWHKLAQGLPVSGHEHDFDQEFDQAIVHAYEAGTISFEERAEQPVLWRSPAVRLEEKRDKLKEGRGGLLIITPDGISFGSLVRKWKQPMSAISDVSADENVLTVVLEDSDAPVLFELEPVQLTIKLEHSKRTVELNALNLAMRLAREIKMARREAVALR